MLNLLAANKDDKRNEDAKIKLLESGIDKIQKRVDILYEDRLNGIISPEDFKRMSAKSNAESDLLKSQLEALKSNPKKLQSKKEQEEIIKEFLSLSSPTQALMAQLIDRIEVREGREFDIYFTFPELQNMMESSKTAVGNIGH
jgi:hypothetical protein